MSRTEVIRLVIGGLVAAGVVAWSLAAGKTINPLRGMKPFLVSRSEQPELFWSGVVWGALFWGFFFALGSGVFVH